ncbi:hypothetical protein BDR03DRAFT_1014065 [Suillus americanus]|nr:hypothetical protein BDR03DRAFT_1014065 [Suillus americanus]
MSSLNSRRGHEPIDAPVVHLDGEGMTIKVLIKVLIAATIEQWIAQLTSNLNYNELLNFFLTYRTYISAVDLCHLLICHFHWALSGKDDIVWKIVRVWTFTAIRYWLLTFFVMDFLLNQELRLLWLKHDMQNIDDLQNVIQGISKEGQTLQSLVTNIKSSHSQGLKNLEGAVADLDARFSNYKDASQRSIYCKSELFRQCHSSIKRTLTFKAEVQTDLNLHLTALEKQVSKVQNSKDVHGQILHMSAKELACRSFWCTIVNEMEDIRNRAISETNSLLPCPGDDLRDEMLRSDVPPAYACLPVGTPAHQLYTQIMEEDSVQTPCKEVAGASATVVRQPPFHSKMSTDLADTCGLLALGKNTFGLEFCPTSW